MTKIISFLLLLITVIPLAYGQADSTSSSPTIINGEYAQPKYNAQTRSTEFSYNYSNLWDLDGDGKKDSLYFIGNGGAHTYFYLSIALSSTHTLQDFFAIQLDMPYVGNSELLKAHGKNPGIQFVAHDFNNDGSMDLYLNFDNPFGAIPKDWKQKGILTKYVVLSFAKGKLKVKDY